MQFQVRNRDPAASRGEAPKFIASIAYSIEVEVTDPEYVLRLSRWQAMLAGMLLRAGSTDPEPGCCGVRVQEGAPLLREAHRICCDGDKPEAAANKKNNTGDSGTGTGTGTGSGGSDGKDEEHSDGAHRTATAERESDIARHPLTTPDGPAFLRQRIARQIRSGKRPGRRSLPPGSGSAPASASASASRRDLVASVPRGAAVTDSPSLWGSAPTGLASALAQHDRVKMAGGSSKREPVWVTRGPELIARFVVEDAGGRERSDMIEMRCPVAEDAELGTGIDSATVVSLLSSMHGNGSARMPEMHVRGTRSQLEAMRLKIQVEVRKVRVAPRSCPTCSNFALCVDATRCDDCLDDCCKARICTSQSARARPHDPFSPFNFGNSFTMEKSSRVVGVASISLQGCTTSFLAPLSGHVIFDVPALRVAGWPAAAMQSRKGSTLPGLAPLPGMGVKPELGAGRIIGGLIRGFVEWRAMKNRLLPLFSQPASAVSAGARFQKVLADAVFLSLRENKQQNAMEGASEFAVDLEGGDGDEIDDGGNRTGVVGHAPDGSASEWPGVLSGTDASAMLRRAGVQARVQPSRFLKSVHARVQDSPHLVVNLTQIGGIERLLQALTGDSVTDASTSVQLLDQGPGKESGVTGGEEKDFVVALRWAGQQHAIAMTATDRGVLQAVGPVFLEIPLTPGAQERLTGIVQSVDDSSV